MAQTGDEKQSGGNIFDENATQFQDYLCVFRPAADSLFIMMKHAKSKRTFTNTFSKSTLGEMGFIKPRDQQPWEVDQIVNLLLGAQSSKNEEELSFKIGFGDAEATKQVSFDKLSKSFSKGNALYIFVNINRPYLQDTYIFKVLEQSYVI